MSNVISFVQRKALKEISEHYNLDINSLKKEGVTCVEDYDLVDTGEIEDHIEEEI
jgi:hypothetical protein